MRRTAKHDTVASRKLAATHEELAAGFDEDFEFQVGDHVMTVDGPGVIAEIESLGYGYSGYAMSYIIDLDNDLGGGEYNDQQVLSLINDEPVFQPKHASSMMRETAHRGIPLALDERLGLPVLTALTAGNHEGADHLLVEAMSQVERDHWWAVDPAAEGSGGAGRWWTSDKSAAYGYATSSTGAWITIPVLLTAEFENDGTEPDYNGSMYWHLPHGHPVTIKQFEACYPDDPKYLIDAWKGVASPGNFDQPQSYWQGEWRTLNVPSISTTARRYSDTPLACDGCGGSASVSRAGGKDGHRMLCPECAGREDEARSAAASLSPSRTAARADLPLKTLEEIEAEGLHVAMADYPELGTILWDRPDLVEAMVVPRTMRLFMGSKTAAVVEPTWLKERTQSNEIKRSLDDKNQPFWWRKIVGPAIDRYNDKLPDARRLDDGDDLHQIDSVQWCRFRRKGDCYFPKEVDTQGSAQAGYTVWTPFERGECPWKTMEAQKTQCPVSEPGPDSGESIRFPDATISWSQGGQRKTSTVTPVSIKSKPTSHQASFVDVRDKAKRIRAAHGVRIIAVVDDPPSVTAEIKGETSLYTTTISMVPGTTQVALSTCSCPWETFRWARSEQYKPLEGRSCAHILALLYEMQAQRMFGGVVMEDSATPDWRTSEPSLEAPRPYSMAALHPKVAQVHLAALGARWALLQRDALVDPKLDEQIVSVGMAMALIRDSLAVGVIEHTSKLADVPPFYAQVNGEMIVIDGFDDDGRAWANGQMIPSRSILYPTFHPSIGLHASKTASKPPSAREVGQAWVRYFGNAQQIRQAADELLGLERTPIGVVRPWASSADIDDPKAYAQVMLDAAAASGAPLPMKGNKFARPAGTPALVGGTSPVELYRLLVLESDELDEFLSSHRAGAQVPLSLAAASPNRSLVAKMSTVKGRGQYGSPQPIVRPDRDYCPVLMVFEPPVPGLGRGSDEFIVSGKFEVTNVRGSEMMPVSLTPNARSAGISGIEITLKTTGTHYASTADYAWQHIWDGHAIMPEDDEQMEMTASLDTEERAMPADDHTEEVIEADDGSFTHAGLIVKALDSGRILMTQRTPYHKDDEGVYGTWEMPGGGIDEGETPLEAALREFQEETGLELPDGYRVEGCQESGSYMAILVSVPGEAWTTSASMLHLETMGIGWFDPDHVEGAEWVRTEVKNNTDWDLVKSASAGKHTLYRGINLNGASRRYAWGLDEAVVRKFNKAMKSGNQQAAAALVLDLCEQSSDLVEGGNLGVWWSTDLAVARGYAGIHTQDSLGCVIYAEVDDAGVDQGAGTWRGFTSESPIVLRPGAQIDVTAVEVRYNPDKSNFSDGEFVKIPIRRQVTAAWYHGTDADLHPGDVVVPGSEIGKANFTYTDVPEHANKVWVTTKPGEEGAEFYGGHVYEVEPKSAPVVVQPEFDEWSTDRATVIRQVSAVESDEYLGGGDDETERAENGGEIYSHEAFVAAAEAMDAELHEVEPVFNESDEDDGHRPAEVTATLAEEIIQEDLGRWHPPIQPVPPDGRMDAREPFVQHPPQPRQPGNFDDPHIDEAPFVPGDPRLAHLMSEGPEEDGDIAAAAQAMLAKMALKSFSPAEQRALIDEGADTMTGSRNDDVLEISETHYALQLDGASDDFIDW